MDQGPLVREQIDAGAKFLAEFKKRLPLQAAFWLKEEEVGRWHLYVASNKVDDHSPLMPAYREVIEAARGLDDPNFDVFQVKLVGVDDPLTLAAMDVFKGRPSAIAAHFSQRYFGRLGVEEGYIYPTPVTAP